MTSTFAPTPQFVGPRTLGDSLVGSVRRRFVGHASASPAKINIALSTMLVIAGAGLTAAAAQVRITLGFTPVPITGQTFAVLFVGSALGWKRGALSQLLYISLAALGLPILTGHKGGWEAATGSSMGYLVGFVIAAAFVGHLAQRNLDRNFSSSIASMLAGSAVIYVCGALWLAHSLHIPVSSAEGKNAIALGVAPFLVGDTLKMLLAAGISPLAWKALQRKDRG